MHKYWQSIVSHHTHVPHVPQPDFTRFHFSIPNLNKFHPVVLPTRSTPSLVICSRTSPSCITLFSFSFLQRLRHKAARSQQEPSPKIVKLFSSRAARRQVHVHAGPCTEPSCRVNDDWECVNKRWGHKGWKLLKSSVDSGSDCLVIGFSFGARLSARRLTVISKQSPENVM